MIARRVAGFVLLGLLLMLVSLRLAWVVRNYEQLKPVAGGSRAPDFTLPLFGGGEFRLGAAPQVTLIDFFATWCGPCRDEIPHIDALYRRYRDRGVRVVAVDVEGREAEPEVARLARTLHLDLPIALQGTGAAEQYRVDSLPHVVVVDAGGNIRRVFLGVQPEDEIAAALDAARIP